MKKILAAIPAVMIFVMFAGNLKIYAASYNGLMNDSRVYNAVIIQRSSDGYWSTMYLWNEPNNSFTIRESNGYLYCNTTYNTGGYTKTAWSSNIPIDSPNTDYNSSQFSGDQGPLLTVISIKGNNIPVDNPNGYYGSYDDYLNPPTPIPDPSWYQEMWDTLKEELGNPAFWFGDWFINIIDNVFGDNEDDPTGPPKPPNSTHVQINNPTITPAPTPIPYSTVIIPKTDIVTGETVYETNYYYTISGTPIITTSPPTNAPATGNGGNGTDYSPLNGDPYSIPQLSWLTNAALDDGNNTMDGISSIADGMDSIDAIGSDYTDGMGVVQDATGTLPTSWLLLIGIAAAIPLIAGIVSRFLS